MSTFSTKDFVFIHLKYCRGDEITRSFGNNKLIQYDYKYNIFPIGYEYDDRANLYKPPRHVGASKIYKQPINDGYITLNDIKSCEKTLPIMTYAEHPILWYHRLWSDDVDIFLERGGFTNFNIWLANMIDEASLNSYKIGLYSRRIKEAAGDNVILLNESNCNSVLNKYGVNITMENIQIPNVDNELLDKILQLDKI